MCLSDLSGGHLLQTQLLPASAPNGEKAGYVLDFISSVHQMCLNSCDFKIEYYISFNVFLWSCSQGWGVILVTYMWKHRGRVSEWSMWWTPITDTTTTVLPYWHQIVSVAYPSRPTVDSSISADSSNTMSGLSQHTLRGGCSLHRSTGSLPGCHPLRGDVHCTGPQALFLVASPGRGMFTACVQRGLPWHFSGEGLLPLSQLWDLSLWAWCIPCLSLSLSWVGPPCPWLGGAHASTPLSLQLGGACLWSSPMALKSSGCILVPSFPTVGKGGLLPMPIPQRGILH